MMYPARLRREPEGGYSVSFRDIPGAHTQGDDVDDALHMAEDVLACALSDYAEEGKPFPRPSAPRRGERLVFLPALIQAKLALWVRMGQLGLTQAGLAERLGVDRKVVQRLMKLAHNSRIEKIEAALGELGKRLSVSVNENSG